MTYDATVDRILQRVVPGAGVDRSVLDNLVRGRPRPEALVRLLADAEPETVRAAVLYLGLYGSTRQSAVLALCLQHEDEGVVRLAEHCLWSIWMRSGTAGGNRRLAAAIDRINTGNYTDAIRILSALVADEPTFAEAHFQYGLALSSADRVQEAARAYQQTLHLNPYHFGAAAALGHALVEQGILPGALHYYRQALRIHPRLEDVPEALRELESIVGPRGGNGA